MDLYDDLPPVSDSSDPSTVIAAGWAHNKPKVPTLQPFIRQTSKPSANVAAIAPNSAIDKVVSTLKSPVASKATIQTFKPRQTTAATSASRSNTAKNLSDDQLQQTSNSNIQSHISKSILDTKTSLDSFADEKTLNFECDDEYDPSRPNDYLQWCEERLEQKRIARVAEENATLLEEQERERRKREDERAEAVKSGDMQRLQEMVSTGRGRGRGVVNLPSWMTNNMTSIGSNINDISLSEGVSESKDPRFDDADGDLMQKPMPSSQVKRAAIMKPSKVVLILNMVTPSDVDPNLREEVISECSKYGDIRSCEIVVVDEDIPVEQRVRTFIEFERQQSAVTAYRDLNGRYFGGRLISVEFYDESLYSKGILQPNSSS